MMKRGVFSIAVCGCVLALMVTTALAQMPGAPLRAKIPFDFMVRGVTLPAGEYEISRINDELSGLEIANREHRSEHTMFTTEPVIGQIPNRGEIVFHRYG